MKKLLFILFVGCALIGNAQKNAIPTAAIASFDKTFVGVSNVKWEKEDNNYEVNFMQKGNKMSAVLDAKGLLLETEIELSVADLPASIITYMKEHYKGKILKGGAKIIKKDGSINYEAALKGKDVIFDKAGKFIKESKD